VRLFDEAALAALQDEFCASMRSLFFDLCGELEGRYRGQARLLRLAPSRLRAVGLSLPLDRYSNWKVVGWVEELNDLVYFLDVQWQLQRERDRPAFAESFLAACEEQFYEHTYLDQLFPRRKPEPAKLPARLTRLCSCLARNVVRESQVLAPGLRPPFGRYWQSSRADFEQAELPGWVAVGSDGARLHVRSGRLVAPEWIRPPGPEWPGGLTLGPTLVYGRDRTPIRVVPTGPGVAERIQRALALIEAAWPEGHRLLARLTNRIVPLKARGVVSFSYRHRPGLSFINVFERDDLDLIDDLIHENAHHHLNLLLRKWVLYHHDRNQEIFYSPWRRRLRPLRGILHATFTFTMGAIVFERLSSWAQTGGARLAPAQILRARFRCLEEIDAVRYSLTDLAYARKLRWLTTAGWKLVGRLAREIEKVEQRIRPFERRVLRSHYGADLTRHRKALAAARETYGLI
jgi:HEXXH motif-containing protein